MEKEFEKMIYNCIAVIITLLLNIPIWVSLIIFLGGDIVTGLVIGAISALVCLFGIWKG